MTIGTATKSAKRIKPKHLLLLAVGIIILLLAFKYAGFSATMQTLYVVNPVIISIFAISRAAIYLLSSYRWKIFVDKVEKISFSRLLPVYFSGMILDNLIPGPGFGGEPVKAYYLSKMTGKKFSHFFATALMDSITFSLVLIGFFAFSAAYVFLYIPIPIIRWFLGIVLVAFAIAIATLYYFYSRKRDHAFIDKVLGFFFRFKMLSNRFSGYAHFKAELTKNFSEFMVMLRRLYATKAEFSAALCISAVLILVDVAGTLMLANSFGAKINFMQMLVVVIISGFIGFYSAIPGGTGAAEGSMILLLNFFGINAGIAGAVTLISRLSFYLITYGFGYLALAYVNLKYIR